MRFAINADLPERGGAIINIKKACLGSGSVSFLSSL
jgi:hypothetical protein